MAASHCAQCRHEKQRHQHRNEGSNKRLLHVFGIVEEDGTEGPFVGFECRERLTVEFPVSILEEWDDAARERSVVAAAERKAARLARDQAWQGEVARQEAIVADLVNALGGHIDDFSDNLRARITEGDRMFDAKDVLTIVQAAIANDRESR